MTKFQEEDTYSNIEIELKNNDHCFDYWILKLNATFGYEHNTSQLYNEKKNDDICHFTKAALLINF